MVYCHDKHTLYVETGIAERTQVETCFGMAIKKLRIPCRLKVNLVSNRNGYCGYAYVWLSSQRVYNAILGKNLDGSERIVYNDDPTWTQPEKSLEDALNTQDSTKNMSHPLRDIVDEEQEIRQRYQCPQIKQDLDCLVKVPGYRYNETQMKYLNGRAIERHEDPDEIPEMGFFEI